MAVDYSTCNEVVEDGVSVWVCDTDDGGSCSFAEDQKNQHYQALLEWQAENE